MKTIPFLPDISRREWRRFVRWFVDVKRLRHIQQIERWISVIEMRKDGLTFSEIGKNLEISSPRAAELFHEAVRVAKFKIEKQNQE